MTLRSIRRALLAGVVVLLVAGCSDPTQADLLATARSHLEKQDRVAARLDLKSLLQAFPDSGEGRYLLGTVLFDDGDPAGAEAEFRRALQAGYDADRIAPRLAATLMVRRAHDAVIQEFGDKDLKDDKAASALLVQVAAAHLAKDQFDAADQAVAKALQRTPEQAEALVMRARLLAARGQTAAARTAIDTVVARAPDNPAAWLLKGDLLLRDAAGADAGAEALRKALALQPAMVPAHVALITMLISRGDYAAADQQWRALKKVQPRHPQTLYFEAVLALQKGDGQRALEITQWLLRSAPDDAAVLLMAGRAELLQNSLVRAEALLGKAMALDPKSAAPRRSLAEVQVRSGQAGKALATLKPLLDVGTEDADVLTIAAEAQLKAGNTAAATALLSRAGRTRPDDQRVRTVLALTHLREGKAEAAFRELESLAKSSDDLQVHLALVNARLQRKEFDAALKAIDALAARRPSSAQPDQLRGQVALHRGDRATARTSFEAALGKDANNLQALSQLAALDLADGQAAAARARMESLVQRQPASARARLLLAEVAARSGAPREEVSRLLEDAVKAQPAEAESRLALIDHLLGSGDARAAVVAAQNAVAAVPSHPDLLDRLGRAQLVSGDPLQAAATFNRLAVLQPKSALPVLRLAEAQLAGRDQPAAAASVRRALQLEPKSAAALQAGVSMALRANQPDEALAVARTAQTQQPDDALGWLLEGEVALERERFDDAAAAFRAALRRSNPGLAPIRLHLALQRAGKTTEADRFGVDWMKAHPDDAVFPYHLADLALVDKRWDEAEQRFRAIVKRQPAHAMALNNLASVLLQLRKPGALELAERAAKLAPTIPAVHDTLSLAYAAGGQIQNAVQAQERAVGLSPNAGGLRLRLAKLYIAAGDTAKAQTELGVLSRLGNTFSEHAEVARLVSQVGVADAALIGPTGGSARPASPSNQATSQTEGLWLPVVGSLAAMLVLVLAIAAFRNKFFEVKRSLVIHAPAQRVFDLLQDLRLWERWAAWPPYDGATTRAYLGPQPIKACTWRNERRRVHGSLEIVHRDAPGQLAVELEVEGAGLMRRMIAFQLTADAGNVDLTRVGCEMRGPVLYAERVLGVFYSVDRRIGRTLTANLRRLKSAAESG